MIRTVLAAATAALVFAVPAAADRQVYTLELASVSPGTVSFTVSRTDTRSTKTEWVQTECYLADGSEWYQQAAIQWGLWSSLSGVASTQTTGISCEAYVTTDPHYRQPKSNVVEFVP